MSMITSAAWVPRGFAAPFPAKYEFDETEFERIANLAKLQLDDAQEDLKDAQEAENGGSNKEGDENKKPEVPKADKYVLSKIYLLPL